jgi:D-arabinitol dehydrogenase (NADP+)
MRTNWHFTCPAGQNEWGCTRKSPFLACKVSILTKLKLTIASKAGPKLDLARSLHIADEYVTISDTSPQEQMSSLETANPYGFDIVIEATGSPSVLESSLLFVRKGGKLVVYGVYDESVKISWSPFRIWEHEITIMASFCSMGHMPQVLEYVRAGKLKMAGVVSRTFRIEEWEECLEVVRMGECVKAAIVFD